MEIHEKMTLARWYINLYVYKLNSFYSMPKTSYLIKGVDFERGFFPQ